MPDVWKNASFINLRAEGAFLVSSVREEGATKFFSIESLAGEPCVIKSDIKVDSLRNSKDIKILKESEYLFSVEIPKGQRITFYKSGHKDLEFTYPATKTGEGNYWGSKKRR
jgi:hypothetical protein